MKDLLSVIEAAYEPASDVEAWGRNALRALRPHLDRGHGVMALQFAYGGDRGRVHVASLGALGPDEGHVKTLETVTRWHLDSMPPDEARAFARRAYPQAPMMTALSLLLGPEYGRAIDTYLPTASEDVRRMLTACPDAIGVIAGDPSGQGVVFCGRSPKPVRVTVRAAAVWERVAAHLVTGYRLARRRIEEPDAILDPGGKVLHRESSVRRTDSESLAEAARSIDRARGKLRRVEPDRALGLWKGLVAGRWSLVDHFDHDGRRYVVARRNAIDVRPWHALTPREAQAVAYVAQGQTVKLVGYQLGVSAATVAEDLARARSKVGVRSRLELVAAYRADHEGAPRDRE